MNRKWRKRVSTLVVSAVLLSIIPFGGVTAAPLPQQLDSLIYHSIDSNSTSNSQMPDYSTSPSEDSAGIVARASNLKKSDSNEQNNVSTATYNEKKTKDLHSVHVIKELADKRTRNSKTLLNSDGTTTVQTATYSVNYFDGRLWQDIDTTIRQDNKDPNYTHSMLANNFKVKMNNKGINQSVTFAVYDQSVTYKAIGINNVTGDVYDNITTYRNAWLSTDLQYQVQNDQMKMELHLADNKAPKTFAFDLITNNVNYRENPDGSIAFINKSGDIAFQIPQLWVKDATSNVERYDKLQVNLRQKGNKMVLELTLDDKDLQYPITIDPTTTLPIMSGRYQHMLEIKPNGTVWAWGNNSDGQLGNGTTTDSSMPVQVSGLSNVVSAVAGAFHSVALKQDGTVWTWGENIYGQLGNGTTTVSSIPVQVSGLSNIISVSVGAYYSLAVKQDGTVWAWGHNDYGQLGNGTTNDSSTPVQVSGLTNVTNVTAGGFHAVALKQDGTVWAWGYNATGQLGDGTTTSSSTPVQVNGLSNITAIAAGVYHSIAVKQDGTAWAWGYNAYGQLGNGTTTGSLTAVQVKGLSNVISVTAGEMDSSAVDSDASVWTWGDNSYGQLGIGVSGKSTAFPMQVVNLSNANSIFSTSFESLAVKQDGTVWVWGNGQMGSGTTTITTSSSTPVQVSGLSNVTTVTAESDHAVVVKQDGTVWAWGYNQLGQLGNGTTTNSSTPVQVNGLSNITAIAAGAYFTMALKQDGTVWAWGYNGRGQLGNGTHTDSLIPVQVSGISNVIAIAAGGYSSLALKQDGTVWAWGENDFGQLGNGTTSATTSSSTPVQVYVLSNITAITTSGHHSIAVKQDGTVWAWGLNAYGQLGNGTTTNSSTPVQVYGLFNIKAIAAEGDHSLALKQDGTVWAWGQNSNGELGNGTKVNSLNPVQVNGVSNAISVSAGIWHSLALKQDGTVWAWGLNTSGQLGIGRSYKTLATNITSMPPMIILAASTTSFTNQSVTISVNATNHIGVTQTKWASGNQPASYFATGGTVLSGTTFSVSSNGTYTVWATDVIGNQTVQTITLSNIDTVAPTLTLTASTTAPTNQPVTVTVNSTDNVGVTQMKWERKKARAHYFATAGTALSGSSFVVTANGTYTVWATDAVGNQTVQTISISNIDSTPPTAPAYLQIIGTTSTSISLSWTTSSDNVGVTGYDIYNGTTLVGSVNGSTTSYSVTGLAANTLYSFTVKAKDATGNVSAVSNIISFIPNAKLTFTYDSRGRLTSISSTSTGQIVKSFSYDNNGNLLSK